MGSGQIFSAEGKTNLIIILLSERIGEYLPVGLSLARNITRRAEVRDSWKKLKHESVVVEYLISITSTYVCKGRPKRGNTVRYHSQ